MDEVCRLCCSKKFVNNHIFDEGNSLYLKMSLYLPIKVFKNDQLPQKICDKCSCKVNDFYQFCNETIEVQNRLRSLLNSSYAANESVDLTLIKKDVPSPQSPTKTKAYTCGTQTLIVNPTKIPKQVDFDVTVKVKEEPTTPIKQEDDYFDNFNNGDLTDSSDDMSLMNLKQMKQENDDNKDKLNDLNFLFNSINGHEKNGKSKVKDKKSVRKRVKKEAGDSETYQCCMCFTECYSRPEILQHYKEHVAGEEAREPPDAPPPPAEPPLRCPRCNKKLESGEWARHWQRHWRLDARPYRCARCHRVYRTHHQIFKHGLSHKEGEPTEPPITSRFICDLCPEQFAYLKPLHAHRAARHAGAGPLALRCAVCARPFAHANSLRRHLRAHSGARDHLCSACGKALSSREHLKHHMRIHTGYKPHNLRQGFRKEMQLESARASSLRRETARVFTLRESLQPAIHTQHTRTIPQRRPAVRVRGLRARVRGQGPAVHAPQDYLRVTRCRRR